MTCFESDDMFKVEKRFEVDCLSKFFNYSLWLVQPIVWTIIVDKACNVLIGFLVEKHGIALD